MDYYELLGVDRDASEAEIETAFREAAKETHPDVSDDPNAQEKFTAITRARDILTDSADRRQYDRLGHVEYVERIEGRSVDQDWESETAPDSGTDDGDETRTSRESSAATEEPRSDATTETDRRAASETAAEESATDTTDEESPTETAAGESPADRTAGKSTADTTAEESTTDTATEESTADTTAEESTTDTAAGKSATGTTAEETTTGTTPEEATTETTDGEAAATASSGGTTTQSRSEARTESTAETKTTETTETETTADAEPDQRDESTADGSATVDRSAAVDRGAAVDEWRKRHGSDSYPNGPFDDPLANAAARAWLGRLSVTAVVAAVLVAVLSAPSVVGTDPLPPAVIDALDRLRLLLVRPDLGPVVAVAVVVTGAVGNELRSRGTIPVRTRHAVRPPRRTLLVAAGAAALCPVGWAAMPELGGDPAAIVTAALPIVAAVSVFVVAVGSLATSVERALLVSLPLGVAAGGVALSQATPAVPIGSQITAQPTIAVGAGLLAVWSLSVGAPLAAARTSQYVWNLRYRGGVGLAIVLWELALVVPVVVLAWTVVVSAPAVALPTGAEIARLDLLPIAAAVPIVVAGAVATRGWLGR